MTLRLRDGGQTQTVTLSQLDDAVAVVGARRATGRRRATILPRDLRVLRPTRKSWSISPERPAIERGDGSGADTLFWAQATLKTIDAHSRELAQFGLRCFAPRRRGSRTGRTARAMALAMDFGFLFDRVANCCRSDSQRQKARSIRTATICWRPRRDSPVSSPSPKGMSPPNIGSGSAAP